MRSIRNMKSGGTGTNNNGDATRESVESLKHKYDDKSESELMDELFRKVYAAKNDGSFSAEQLDDFVKFVSPNLDEAQSKRLAELVRMIKNR